MDDQVPDIKPCPFCGSLGVAVVGSFVRCGSCGAAGPYGYTDVEAVARWNGRAQETSSMATLAVPMRSSEEADPSS